LDTNKKILKWYDQEKRDLPWRKSNKLIIDVYKVWISEIMLQQTTVNAVIPFFETFIIKFPDVHSLAKARIEDVMTYWAGLGYYSRARNLHKCAKIIINDYNGIFPKNEIDLVKLPGIGDYTAGAICAIAYNQVAAPVDVNIERVISRISNEHNTTRREIKELMRKIIPVNRPGDFIEAIMDLGSKICKIREPKCMDCPINTLCKTYLKNKLALLHVKINKPKTITRHGNCYIINREIDDKYFFIRMPTNGLLGGMLCFPSTNWIEDKKKLYSDKMFEDLIRKNTLCKVENRINHTFSHFKLILNIYSLKYNNIMCLKGEWMKLEEAVKQLPSLMRKVAKTI
jgi:A/G-specific adenine glycosylase